MAVCVNCGKTFEISRLRKIFGSPSICPSCKDEKDKKIQRYLEAVKYLGKDKYLSYEDEKKLQELKSNLGLSEEDIKQANKKIEQLREATLNANIALCEQRISQFLSDGQISQAEERELSEMMQSFNISEINLSEKTRQDLYDVRMLTRLAQGEFPILDADILLKRGEACHFMTFAQLLEEKTKTRYVGGSSGVSFRVAKGVTFRTGSFRGSPIKETYKEITDTGRIYVTNKRVLFIGARKNVSYQIDKIINITKYTDGIKFQKENESKQRVFLIERPGHIDAIGLIVSKLAQFS